MHLVAISTQRASEDRVADALSQVQGAYSLVCLTPSELIAVRDPLGIRPLCLGKMSETGTTQEILDLLQATRGGDKGRT